MLRKCWCQGLGLLCSHYRTGISVHKREVITEHMVSSNLFITEEVPCLLHLINRDLQDVSCRGWTVHDELLQWVLSGRSVCISLLKSPTRKGNRVFSMHKLWNGRFNRMVCLGKGWLGTSQARDIKYYTNKITL